MEVNNINITHKGDKINDQVVNTPIRHSSFDLSQRLAMTMRFGEYTPHFALESNPKDSIPYSCSHALRTYTMKAPLMQNVTINKDYYSVPYMAILPFNWDKIYANPNIGDDVPEMTYCSLKTPVTYFDKVVDKLIGYINVDITGLKTAIEAFDPDSPDYSDLKSYTNTILSNVFLLTNFIEYFLSEGSLVNYLGRNFSKKFKFATVSDTGYTYYTPSEFCSWLYNWVKDNFTVLGIRDDENDPKNSILYSSTDLTKSFDPTYAVDFHTLIEFVRDNGYVNVTYFEGESSIDFYEALLDTLPGSFAYSSLTDADKPFDFSRVAAYQLVCSHFYSNDKVDYIYSAELYRQYIYSIICDFINTHVSWVGTDIPKTFEYNGIDVPYDYLSGYFFSELLDKFTSHTCKYSFRYFAALFNFKRSLRYADYFTGAKTQPLAVGNTDVNVNNDLVGSTVSVIDITRSIQMQRFLNAVNRSGRKISNYVKGLFGVNQAHDFHDPEYLAHTEDRSFNDETQNTAESQFTDSNSVSSIMRSNSSKYAFEFNCDRPGVIIGITYFDISRFYPFASERQTFISDRFDMYNPYLENIGDQAVFVNELTSDTKDLTDDTDVFAYQTRYMEYKQKFDRALGGFVRNLPGYSFNADVSYRGGFVNRLGPDYIRSHNSEFDEFYVSLTGNELSEYFHFILLVNNIVDAKRDMSYNPNIL